jgi:dTDP-glucose 4,6-dehydratase
LSLLSKLINFKDNPIAGNLDYILTHTEVFWEKLRGERIFITGDTGFFGCWLLESFAWANGGSL